MNRDGNDYMKTCDRKEDSNLIQTSPKGNFTLNKITKDLEEKLERG